MNNVTDTQFDRFSLFSEARERLCTALGEAVTRLAPVLVGTVRRQMEKALDLEVRSELQEAYIALKSRESTLGQEAAKRFTNLAFKRLELETNSPAEDLAGGLLALIPEADLDEQIFSSELAQRIRGAGGEEYVAFITRVHHLTQFSAAEDRSPMSAAMIAAAVVQTLRSVSQDRRVWASIRREIASDFPADIASAMADINDHLRACGVLPSLQRFIAKVDPVKAVPVMPKQTGQSSAQSLAQSLAQSQKLAVGDGINEWASGYANAGESNVGLLDRAALAVESALHAGKGHLSPALIGQERLLRAAALAPIANIEMEASSFADSVGAIAYSRDARNHFYTQLRIRLPEAYRGTPQVAVIDVVHALFDYAVDDKQVPEAAKPLLWRLQLPTVSLALMDSRYLGDQSNSMRRLVEDMAAIVMAFPDDIVKGSELWRRLESAVRAVEIVAHTLQSRAGVLASQVEKQFGESAKGVAMIADRVQSERTALESMPEKRNRRDYRHRPSRDVEQSITGKVSQQLAAKLQDQSVPESVRQFLSDVWLRHMRTAALRSGEDSGEYQVALQVVDELLWSLTASERKNGRKKLAARIPPLVRTLTQGVKSVGVEDKVLRSFFDELFLIHLRRMQRSEVLQLDASASLAAVSAGSQGDESTIAPEPARVSNDDEMAIPVLMPELNPELDQSLIGRAARRRVDIDDKPMAALLPIPSLSDLAPERFAMNRDDRFAIKETKQERSAPGTRSQRIGEPVRPQPSLEEATTQLRPLPPLRATTLLKSDTQTKGSKQGSSDEQFSRPSRNGPVKLQGMEQVAAAASIRMLTVPMTYDTAIKPAQAEQSVDWTASASEKKLLELLNSIDMNDGHIGLKRRELSADKAMDSVQVNTWVELSTGNATSRFCKVAWINERRTVVLMVRESDRKALSLRSGELLSRFAQKRAWLLHKLN